MITMMMREKSICFLLAFIMVMVLGVGQVRCYVVLNNCMKKVPVEILDVDVPTTIHLSKFNGNIKYKIKAVTKQPLPHDLKIKTDFRREYLGVIWANVPLCVNGLGTCEFDIRNATYTSKVFPEGKQLKGGNRLYEINNVLPLRKDFDYLGISNELLMGNYLIRVELKQKTHDRTLACFDLAVKVKA